MVLLTITIGCYYNEIGNTLQHLQLIHLTCDESLLGVGTPAKDSTRMEVKMRARLGVCKAQWRESSEGVGIK